MSSSEQLRTFVAVYRAGSVTNGARHRLISQPAASQQLAALERAVGAALFARVAGGVEPTGRGRELYAEVAPLLDRLEPILSGLDGGRIDAPLAPVRVASTAEHFAARVLPAVADLDVAVSARFGDTDEVLRLLEAGEVDIALAPTPPRRRQLVATPVGSEGFTLVVGASVAPRRRLRSLDAVGEWLTGRPWVAYSHELPITRRFWQQAFGRSFTADLRLAAPDLRVVAGAVAAGMGTSLLPSFVVADLLAAGDLVELTDVSGVVAPQPWFAATSSLGGGRPEVASVLAALSDRP
jgi:DNA-binding transcriptional LysR family regulator